MGLIFRKVSRRSAPAGAAGADGVEGVDPPAKRLCVALDAIADEWICPITLDLPLDPVVAEDGRTYERAAIA